MRNQFAVQNRTFARRAKKSTTTPKKKKAAASSSSSSSSSLPSPNIEVPPRGSKRQEAAAPALSGSAALYGNALFQAGKELNNLPDLVSQMETLASLVQSPPLEDSIKAASTGSKGGPEAQKKVVAELLGTPTFAKEFDDSITRTLEHMANAGVLDEISDVCDGFSQLAEHGSGVVKSVVTSAQPLTPQQVSNVRASLLAYVGEDETLETEFEVNPDILGGLQIQVGNLYGDFSLIQRVNTTRDTLASGFDVLDALLQRRSSN